MSLDAFFCFLFFYSTRYIRVMLVYRSESYVNAAICLERVVLGGDLVDEVASDKWNLGEDVPLHSWNLAEKEDGEDASSSAKSGSEGTRVEKFSCRDAIDVRLDFVLGTEFALVGLVIDSLAPWVNTLDAVGRHAII